MESPFVLIGIVVLAIFGFVLAIIMFNFFGIWLRARIANAPVGMGKMIGMRSFGASAPLKDLLKKFGIEADKVVAAAREVLGK